MKRLLVFAILVFLCQCGFSQNAGGIVKRPSNKTTSKRVTTPQSKAKNPNHYIIKRDLDGITLGKTTKQGVISLLKRKGKSYSMQEVGDIPVIEVDEKSIFGGIAWYTTLYYLYNNIVFKVEYIKNAKSGAGDYSVDLEYSILERSLINKYGKYKLEEISDQDYFYTSFFDLETEVNIAKGNYEGYYYLSLSYTDMDLFAKSNKETDNGL